MSDISMASVRDKADLLKELKDVQKQLLEKAKQQAGSKNLHEADTTHERMSSKSSHKSKDKKDKKKKKKHKKLKKKRQSSTSNSEDDNYGTDLKCESGNKNYSDSNSDADEWVEKKPEVETQKPLDREDWLKDPFLIPTYSKTVEKKEKNKNQDYEPYDPAKSSRELNPHWKGGGSGIPAFKKPSDDIYETASNRNKPSFYTESRNSYSKGNWRKSKEQSCGYQKEDYKPSTSTTTNEALKKAPTKDPSSFLTDQQMNEIGAKLIKAEILGNTNLVKELQEKLERARETRNQLKNSSQSRIEDGEDDNQHILLTTTDRQGVTRPLSSRSSDSRDPHNNRGKRSKKHVNTHEDGKRTKYFPDDDRYDIKQMFEREKHLTASDADAEFVEIAGKQRNKKDDLEDIFADEISKANTEEKQDAKDKNRAIREHERYEKMLETCEKCFDSNKMDKDLLVTVGSSVYLSLPWHEGVQPGHCLIVPIHHASCSTQLDEDVWSEINDFRKALTKMFAERSEDVIFFEIARYLNRRPHMEIHCIPSKNFEMAPFYFKKAIQESEYMWSTNKQLISLKDTNLRRAIPKGLPYFWVNFGMDSGFAHVIEDQEKFPSNFAQEIIGGMLELDPRVWRRPRKEQNPLSKVKIFSDGWKPFDCSK